MYTYNVWNTVDIIFRRERRETALHHSSLSCNFFLEKMYYFTQCQLVILCVTEQFSRLFHVRY